MRISDWSSDVCSSDLGAAGDVQGRAGPGIIRKEDEPMITTTTHSVEGRTISAYLGVVTGAVIVGANIFRDLFAGIRDIVGGRAGSYENVLRDARRTAFAELEAEAGDKGANAVVGIDIDYEVLGQGGSMLMVSVSGTAVKLG